jgi:hypothetical protein
MQMTYSGPMRARRSAFAALVALAGLLFTQVAIAAAAWDSLPSPCHEQAPANYCFQHCSNNDLTLDVPRVKLPAIAAASLPFSLITPMPYPQVASVRVVVLPAGPPPRILFQSFLI